MEVNYLYKSKYPKEIVTFDFFFIFYENLIDIEVILLAILSWKINYKKEFIL